MKKHFQIIFLFVLSFIGVINFSQAQTPDHYVLNSTTSANAFPLNSSASNQCQFLIVASELSGILQSGNITKIYITPGSTPSASSFTYTNFTVKIGMTTLTDLGSGSIPFITGLTTAVPPSTVTFTNVVAGNWMEIPLDNMISYDGTSNLIIEISQTAYTTPGIALNVNTGITGRRLFGSVSSLSGTAGGGALQFGMDINLTPSSNNAGLTSLTSPLNFCQGTEPIKVMVRNFGDNVIDSVKVGWTLDGIAQPTYSLTTPLDTLNGAGMNEIEVTLGTHTFTTSPIAFKAWTFLPNNMPDTVSQNDTITKILKASISGTYTINSALATGGVNYQSFADFANDLNAYGVCGPVVANVSGGPFNEFIYFENIQGTSAVNTIRINGNGATVQYNNTSTNRQLLTFSGTKYLTIDQLNFITLATDYGWGALITAGAAYDSIINCTFDMSSLTSTASANTNGIAFSASNTTPASVGANGSNCYIGNNHFKWSDGTGGGYYALIISGPSDNNIVNGNVFENFYFYGTYINGATGTKVLNNEYHKENKTTSLTSFYGIYTTGTTPGMEITGNRIHHPGGLNGSTGSFYGIYSLGDGTATEPILIANNAIYQINQNSIVYGIYLSTAPYSFVYHNTVVIDQLLTGTSTNYGLYASGLNTGSEFKNNNIVLTGGSAGIKYGFYYATATSIADVQKNNIYVNSSQAGTQNYGYLSSAYTTKAAFQSANPTLEIGSPDVDPMFVNASAGDFEVQSFELIGNGEDLFAWVPEGINGNPRSGSPTIGAFERPPTGMNNAGISAFVSPSGYFCSGQQSVSVSVFNAGLNDINNVQVHWTVNGVAQPMVNYTGTLVPQAAASGQNADTVILGNVAFQSGATIIKAWTSMPNGVADTTNGNDTIQQSFQPSLSGLYTINSAQPTGGTNYQSFSDFSNDLNSLGVCGPVTANVSGGPFNEVVQFDDIIGASATNTIRINGNGAVVQYNNSSSERQMLTLNGAKYITIDDLAFKTQATDYGWGAVITNNSAYDSIINCTFDLSSVTSISSTDVNGIAFSGTTTSPTATGSNSAHLYIGNNHIKGADDTGGPYYGIALTGDCDSNIFENNIIENFYYYGLRISDGTGNKFLYNEFHKENKTASFSTFYGIYTTGINPGLEIVGNRIHHPGGLTGGSGTFYGIYALGDGTATEPILIANNVFYNLNLDGINRGIYLNTAPYNLVYHNTIVYDQISSSSSAIYAISGTGTNTGTEIKNNNISITGGTSGTKYGFYFSSSISVDDMQKNNFYLNSTQSGMQYYGYYSGYHPTKASFQATYPLLEVGSPDVDPQFFNAAGGDFSVQSTELIGVGENLYAWVPSDINGNGRSGLPTIGAFENAPTGLNNAGIVSFVTPSGTFCPSQQTASVIVYNLQCRC